MSMDQAAEVQGRELLPMRDNLGLVDNIRPGWSKTREGQAPWNRTAAAAGIGSGNFSSPVHANTWKGRIVGCKHKPTVVTHPAPRDDRSRGAQLRYRPRLTCLFSPTSKRMWHRVESHHSKDARKATTLSNNRHKKSPGEPSPLLLLLVTSLSA